MHPRLLVTGTCVGQTASNSLTRLAGAGQLTAEVKVGRVLQVADVELGLLVLLVLIDPVAEVAGQHLLAWRRRMMTQGLCAAHAVTTHSHRCESCNTGINAGVC